MTNQQLLDIEDILRVSGWFQNPDNLNWVNPITKIEYSTILDAWKEEEKRWPRHWDKKENL